MSDAVITYENIYEILRKEKYRTELQKLEKDFLEKVNAYIKDKDDIIQQQKDDTMFSSEIEKIQKQIKNIKKMLKELYEKREAKIIQLALFNSRISSESVEYGDMLDKEKEFYDILLTTFNKFRAEILNVGVKQVLINKPKEIKIEDSKNTVKSVRFLQPIPQLIDENLMTYGPFEKNSVANVPEKMVTLLIKNKIVEEI